MLCLFFVFGKYFVLHWLLQGFTSQQLQAVGDNSAMIEAREKETIQIVKSIQDLNEIFKDLATMITDQVFRSCSNRPGIPQS